ncbi:PAS domain-containing sensor histidine kinase [Pedobacter faecalis]|uniref:PAS domain-containing sensor histidine kinase n=1 Tax=Pedobacter faecalis TaxID=3041495 RepID=UPI00254C17AE|nr:ATP-binding protein [Pedobacter sp. ELA7]
MITSDMFSGEDLLLQLFNQSANETVVFNSRDLNILYVNDAMLARWNHQRSLVGQKLAEAVSGQVSPELLLRLQDAWDTGLPLNEAGLSAIPFPDSLGRTSFLVLTFNAAAEIPEHIKHYNDKLAESEARLQSIFERSPVGISVLTGPDHIIEQANEMILKIWGRTAKEVLGKPHRIARPELKGQPVYDWLDEVLRTGVKRVNSEFRVMLYDNGGLREAYVNSAYQPLKDASGNTTGVLVILDEITDMIKARQEATKVKEMLNLAMESGELGAFYYDPANNRLSGNDLLKSWFGLGHAEHLALETATAAIADEDRDRVDAAIRRALTPQSGGNYEIEYTIIHQLTGVPRMVRAKGKTLFDENGNPLSLNGTLQDITERKKDEQRKDDFIGMVSHELKTPLTSLNAYLQLLQRSARKTEDAYAEGLLEKSGLQLKKMTRMINSFLNISRLEAGKLHLDPQEFDLSALVSELEDEANTMFDSHQFIFDPGPSAMVLADRDKIGQVISNFLTNAVKYSLTGTRVEVTCRVSGGKATVRVKDEGFGIKPEDLPRIFERYFRVEDTNKFGASGFGIGLYLCAEIIERHDGHIRAESTLGQGSAFSFDLPLAR